MVIMRKAYADCPVCAFNEEEQHGSDHCDRSFGRG